MSVLPAEKKQQQQFGHRGTESTEMETGIGYVVRPVIRPTLAAKAGTRIQQP
jgi:hypothetical protein